MKQFKMSHGENCWVYVTYPKKIHAYAVKQFPLLCHTVLQMPYQSKNIRFIAKKSLSLTKTTHHQEMGHFPKLLGIFQFLKTVKLKRLTNEF